MTSLLGKQAPEFHAKAVIDNKIVENFSLSQYKGKYVVFFFYPLDFTFVCPTELHAFQDALEEFEKRDTQLVACSVDSHFSHLAWLNTPKSQGGIQGIDYPIISDLTKEIAQKYGTLIPEAGISYRGLFLIDKEGVIRSIVINDLPIGRSVHETLRTLDALQHSEKYGDVCPANWSNGKNAMKPSAEGVVKFFAAT